MGPTTAPRTDVGTLATFQQPAGQEPAITEIADGGNSRGECPGGVGIHPIQQVLIGAVDKVADWIIGVGLEGQMYVRVDQSRQERDHTEVYELRMIRRSGTRGVHVGDPAVLHQNQHRPAGGDHGVEQTRAAHRQHATHS